MFGFGGGLELRKRVRRGSRERRRRRVGFRLNMTPLFDIALLMMIFFMCITVQMSYITYTLSLIRPEVMKMIIPKEGDFSKHRRQIDSSRLTVFALQIGPQGKVFKRFGKGELSEIRLSQLRAEAVTVNMAHLNNLLTSVQ